MGLGSVKKWAYGAIAGYFQPKPATTKESYFRDSLRVAGSFERAKKFGNPDFAKDAILRFEKLQDKLRTENAPFAYSTELSINLEAYKATGKERYARQAGRDADALSVLELAKPSETEDKLMAASALLKYYELSKEEVYRKKAEELLGGVEANHLNGKFQKKLAYVAYSDADRIVGGFESEKKLFEPETKSIEKDKLGTYSYASQKLASAFYPVASKAVYAAGRVADKAGGYLEGKGWGKTGKGVKFLFGTETLKRTSFGFGTGGVLSIPGLEAVGNVSAGGTLWTGDVNYYEQNGGELSDYHRIVYRGVNTPWAGVGQSTFGPMVSITAIPYTGFTMNRRIESAGLGLSGLLAFGFGKVGTSGPGQYARGPFVTLNMGLGLYWVTLTAYSPALEPLVNWLHPGAAWLRSKNEAILNYAKGHVKRSGKTAGDDAAQPHTGKEIYGTFPFTKTVGVKPS